MVSYRIAALLLLAVLPVPVNISLSSGNKTVSCRFNISSISAIGKYVSNVSLRLQRTVERLFSPNDIVAKGSYQVNCFLSKLIDLHLLLPCNLKQRSSTKPVVSGGQIFNLSDAKAPSNSVHKHDAKIPEATGDSSAEQLLDLLALDEGKVDLLANWPINDIRMERVGRWKEARLAHYMAEQFLKANRCPGCEHNANNHASGCGGPPCGRTDGLKSSRLDFQVKDASASSPSSDDSNLNRIVNPLTRGDRNICLKDRASPDGVADSDFASTGGDRRAQANSPTHQGQVSVRQRNNFASVNCGAKVVAFNREAQNAKEILSENKDAYMLNPCRARIWVIIQLCERIRVESVELASFELFARLPTKFRLSATEEFDAAQVSGDPELSGSNGIRLKWHDLGTYSIPQTGRIVHRFNVSIKNARFGVSEPHLGALDVGQIKDDTGRQGSARAAGDENPSLVKQPAANLNAGPSRTSSYDAASGSGSEREQSIGGITSGEQEAANHEQLYVKYIRFEMIEYEGNEHYCPLSLVRVYGSTLEDVITSQEQNEDSFIEVLQSSLSRTSSRPSSGASFYTAPQEHGKRHFQTGAENPTRPSTMFPAASIDIQLFSDYASSRSLVSCSQYHKLVAGRTSVERKSVRIDDFCCLNLMGSRLGLLLLTTLASSISLLGQADANVQIGFNPRDNPLPETLGAAAKLSLSEPTSRDRTTGPKAMQDVNASSGDGKVLLSAQCNLSAGEPCSHLANKASSSQSRPDMNRQGNDITGASPTASACGDQPAPGSNCPQHASSTIPKPSAKLSGTINAPSQPLLVRFGNRISLLELNVSLHAAYLEELADYYNEKIQFVYNATRGAIEQVMKQGDRQRQLIMQAHRQSLTAKRLEQLVDYLTAESSASLFKSLDRRTKRVTLFLLAVAMMTTAIAASVSILVFLTYHRCTCFLADAPVKEPYRRHSPGYHRLSRAPFTRPLTSSVVYSRRRTAIKPVRYGSALPPGSTSTISLQFKQQPSSKPGRGLMEARREANAIKTVTASPAARDTDADAGVCSRKCYKSTLKWELRRIDGSNQSDDQSAPRRRLSSIIFDYSTKPPLVSDSVSMTAYS